MKTATLSLLRSGCLSVLALLLNGSAVFSQTFAWARQLGGAQFQETRHMCTDPDGNVLVVGSFSGGIQAEDFSLNNNGVIDVFFAKYTPDGELLWLRSMGGGGPDSGYGIGADAFGNVYLAGNFSGTADMDPGDGVFNLHGSGGIDAFLAKYTPDGTLVWAKNISGTSFEEGRCLVVDAQGNATLAGAFNGTADLDPGVGILEHTAQGDGDIFLSRFDADGHLQWARQMGGTGFDRVLCLAQNDQGDLYLGGHFTETADFDPSANTANLTVEGDNDAFFARYDTEGQLVWAKSVGGFFYEETRGIAVDGQGAVYVTGRYGEPVDFDPGPGTHVLDNAGINDAFLAKYDSTGALVWAKPFGSDGNDIGNAVSIDASGRLYCTGQFMFTVGFDGMELTGTGDLDVFVGCFSALTGENIWVKQVGGIAADECFSLCADNENHLYAGGFFREKATFGEVAELMSKGNADAFVVRLESVTTGTNSVSALPEPRLFPVPASNVLNVDWPGEELSYTVLDVQGRVVLTTNHPAINVSTLDNGVYGLLVQHGVEVVLRKFVVAH
ncbi:MAG: hypothetical protein IT270_10280 [Saprospiraceae bacterium]|nr:hypothetical protein [Saprospiraceae bacterium]